MNLEVRGAAKLLGGVLVGGSSSRMGADKAALRLGGRTFLERALDALRPHVSRTFLIGSAARKAELGQSGMPASDPNLLPWVFDVPGDFGPLAGALAALRADRDAAWLLMSCDAPLHDAASIGWLIFQRHQTAIAVMPRLRDGSIEPLPVLFEPAALAALEAQASLCETSLRVIANDRRVATPQIPDTLRNSWRNINTPDDYAAICREFDKDDAEHAKHT